MTTAVLPPRPARFFDPAASADAEVFALPLSLRGTALGGTALGGNGIKAVQ